MAGALFSSVDETYFYSPESIELYHSMRRHMKRDGEAPSYRLLIEDPEVSEEARSHLRDSVPTIQTTVDAAKAVRVLNKYRQARGLFNLAANIDARLKNTRLDVDGLLEETAQGLSNVRMKKSSQDAFLHFGRNNNSNAMVKSILYEDNSDETIPTGIKAFDSVAGGFARGALVTIGANSGGGKCLVGDTPITLADGTTKSLCELWEQGVGGNVPVVHEGDIVAYWRKLDIPVQTYEGPHLAEKVFKTKGKTIKIEFEDGTVIEGLAEHKLMVRIGTTDYAWKMLSELTMESDVLSYAEMMQLLSKSK